MDCQEAITLLAEAGANVSNEKLVKIPGQLVQDALQKSAKQITLFTREGEPYIHLDRTHSYFGAIPDCPDILDPYTQKRRPCYVEDAAALSRLIDNLPNITWLQTTGWAKGLPGEISDKVSLIQAILNTSKPVGGSLYSLKSLKSILEVCTIVSGGLEELKSRPFFYNAVEPVSPLVQGREALEKSLLCAEMGIPNVVYSMPMAGATTPATFAGTLAVCNAEILSHLVVIQLKSPGAPVIYGSMPNIMDMSTITYPYSAPEMNLLIACLTDLSHYYKLPMWGTTGTSDAKVIGAQTGIELMFQSLVSGLSGADFVHDIGLMDHAKMISPELIVLTDEIIDMVRVFIEGITINDQTLALDLIDSIGPGGSYIAEGHTLEHFRSFWMPSVIDRRQYAPNPHGKPLKHCEELVNEKTIKILETHNPLPLSEDIVKEIKKVEKSWFKESGLDHEYPKRIS